MCQSVRPPLFLDQQLYRIIKLYCLYYNDHLGLLLSPHLLHSCRIALEGKSMVALPISHYCRLGLLCDCSVHQYSSADLSDPSLLPHSKRIDYFSVYNEQKVAVSSSASLIRYKGVQQNIRGTSSQQQQIQHSRKHYFRKDQHR